MLGVVFFFDPCSLRQTDFEYLSKAAGVAFSCDCSTCFSCAKNKYIPPLYLFGDVSQVWWLLSAAFFFHCPHFLSPAQEERELQKVSAL